MEEESARNARYVENWTPAYEISARDGQTPCGYESGLSVMVEKRTIWTRIFHSAGTRGAGKSNTFSSEMAACSSGTPTVQFVFPLESIATGGTRKELPR